MAIWLVCGTGRRHTDVWMPIGRKCPNAKYPVSTKIPNVPMGRRYRMSHGSKDTECPLGGCPRMLCGQKNTVSQWMEGDMRVSQVRQATKCPVRLGEQTNARDPECCRMFSTTKIPAYTSVRERGRIHEKRSIWMCWDYKTDNVYRIKAYFG